jgi:serine/threonine-protein kinase SRPK3
MMLAHKGELRHISKLRFWPLSSVLHDKYLFPKENADEIASFLGPMLRLHPDRRGKASELTSHPWVEAIVVQGDLDAVWRTEEEKKRREEAIAGAGGEERRGGDGVDRHGHPYHLHHPQHGSDPMAVLKPSEVDAMKPVDDLPSFADGEGMPMDEHGHHSTGHVPNAASSHLQQQQQQQPHQPVPHPPSRSGGGGVSAYRR